MKIRESGIPDRQMWESFFKPQSILLTLGLDTHVRDAAEIGCGYGTFTLPAAGIISGRIYAFDIDEEMVRITMSEAKNAGLKNVDVILRDIVADGTGLEDGSVDYVMLFNILHLESPSILLSEAKRILKKAGHLGIVHWNYDPSTPRGPSMDIRPRPEDCINWAMNEGFKNPRQYDLKPYHYGIVLTG